MKAMDRKAAGLPGTAGMLVCALVALTSSLDVRSQARPPDLEKLVAYSQCIRANGYPEFPDPSPDGRMQLKLDPKSAGRLETAQRACRDKAPPGMAAADQTVTPERMQALLNFAACVRKRGARDFPDPQPNGIFELTGPTLDLSAPQLREAVELCRESDPPGALSIRMIEGR
jgi:hypothetical protein